MKVSYFQQMMCRVCAYVKRTFSLSFDRFRLARSLKFRNVPKDTIERRKIKFIAESISDQYDKHFTYTIFSLNICTTRRIDFSSYRPERVICERLSTIPFSPRAREYGHVSKRQTRSTARAKPRTRRQRTTKFAR
jgi:hypothetical protein